MGRLSSCIICGMILGNMNVGIVDDKETDLDIYSRLLQKRLDKEDEVYCFMHPDDVKATAENMDVVFMDVQMPEQDGISLAKELLESEPRLILVFLSDYDSYVWDSFSVDAIYYMRKRYFERELPLVLEQIDKRLRERQDEFVTLQEGHKVHHLNVRNILYIEAQKKSIRIVMVDEELEIKYQISRLEKLLIRYGFIKVHRSYLVNPAYIRSIKSREVVLNNNNMIPVSKYRMEEVRNEYMDYLQHLI